MCNLYIHPRHWNSNKRIIDGKLLVSAQPIYVRRCNFEFVWFDGGETWCNGGGECPTTSCVEHYLSLEIEEKQLIGLKFGIDFTGVCEGATTADHLANELWSSVKRAATKLEAQLLEFQLVLEFMKFAIGELCKLLPTKETMAEVRCRQELGEEYVLMFESPRHVPERFKALAKRSNALRDAIVRRWRQSLATAGRSAGVG